MAHMKKGQLVAAHQWWKHLRSWKRDHNKRERKAAKAAARGEAKHVQSRGTQPV